LGSLAGGVGAVNNLTLAKEKIEDAKQVIINTSISVNYFNVENTFNINKPIEIENNKILFIDEDNE